MGFGPDSREGYVSYSAELRHIESGREFNISVGPSSGMPLSATQEELAEREAQNDALFANVVSDLIALGSLEVISAGKFGRFKATLNL